MLSVLELFRIGIGPSSSHTLGPMRIGKRFLDEIKRKGTLERVEKVVVELQGSLAFTGKGHATPKASMLGLLGLDPETLDSDEAERLVVKVAEEKRIALLGSKAIAFTRPRLLPPTASNGPSGVHFDGLRCAIALESSLSTAATRDSSARTFSLSQRPVG